MAPRPKSPYAVQKLLGEHYAAAFHSCFQLETVSLRFFNVYGPRQDPSSPYSGVLSIFIMRRLGQSSDHIRGRRSVTRDFTYVEDVTALLIKAAIGTGALRKCLQRRKRKPVSLNEVWETLQQIAGVRFRRTVRSGPCRRCAGFPG